MVNDPVLCCLTYFFIIFSATSSQLPKVSKKPPKAPVHASSHTSQNVSVSLSTTPSPSYTQSPAPSYANSKVTVNPRWLAVRLPPLKDIFNGSLPVFTSRRYQRQVKSTSTVTRSVDSSETRKRGKKFQPKKFEDYFYWLLSINMHLFFSSSSWLHVFICSLFNPHLHFSIYIFYPLFKPYISVVFILEERLYREQINIQDWFWSSIIRMLEFTCIEGVVVAVIVW